MIKYRTPNQFTKTIYETKELRLEHEWESTYLVRKSDKKIFMGDDFLGEPKCGLIDKENNWAIVAGTHLTLWTPNGETRFQTEKFRDIHSIRLKDKDTFEILIDPWVKFSAIWELSLKNKELKKVKDFNKYQGKVYTANVEW